MEDWRRHAPGSNAVQVDTRALRILLAVLDHRSVTRAAAALGMSQPAVSQTLRRMRDLTGDPLLLRSGAHLVPTPRALEITESLRHGLSEIEAALQPEPPFEASRPDLEFRIASADCMEAFFLPRLIAQIRAEAPHARLTLRSVTADYDYFAALERGVLDAVIANWAGPPDTLRTVRLLTDRIVCMFGEGHPLSERENLTLEEYLTLQHVAPVPLTLEASGPIDGRLTDLGRPRDIRVSVPEFNLVPYVLMSTELVFTSSLSFARHYEPFLPIRSIPAPKELGQMNFFLLWHERAQLSPANRWLREQISAVARQIEAEIAG